MGLACVKRPTYEISDSISHMHRHRVEKLSDGVGESRDGNSFWTEMSGGIELDSNLNEKGISKLYLIS